MDKQEFYEWGWKQFCDGCAGYVEPDPATRAAFEERWAAANQLLQDDPDLFSKSEKMLAQRLQAHGKIAAVLADVAGKVSVGPDDMNTAIDAVMNVTAATILCG